MRAEAAAASRWMVGRVLRRLAWLGAVAFGIGSAGAAAPAPAPAPSEPPPQISRVDAAFVRDLYAHWYLPQAANFAEQGERLSASVSALCESDATATTHSTAGSTEPIAPILPITPALEATRQQWRHTAQAWERLAAVRGGALLARRSPRAIDFMPVRPEAIQRAIRSAPADLAAMERVGSPAKGLPALEWLLWVRPVGGQGAECRYALLVTAEIAAEGLALKQAYAASLAHGWDDKEVEYAMYEFLNLFDAGIQKLWWEDMGRPKWRATTSGKAAGFARSASGFTAQAWLTHWQALRGLAVGAPDAEGAPSLQAYVEAKGHAIEAARLLPLVAKVDLAMAALTQPNLNARDEAALNARIAEAVAGLKALQHFVETEVAGALEFIISFFDEDGD